ncbi:MAG: hypothetical protein AB1476_05365 [Candidatus Hadarchaeota archaeon]
MKKQNWPVLISLFYPLVLAFMAAGMLGFIMLLINVNAPVVAAFVIWFFFICILSIYIISKKAISALGYRRLYLAILIANGLLAIIAAAVLLKISLF